LADYDVIVVGAGISGLSLAHYCAKAGLNTLVLEKSGRVGGSLHSHAFEGEENNFWIELGAHTCYNSYANLIGILEDDEIVGRLLKREPAPFKMLVGEQITSVTSQLKWSALLLHGWRIFTLKKQGRTLRSYYSKLAGEQNYERVLGKAFSAVISEPADDFPAELLFKKRPRRKDIMKKFTLDGGLGTIADSIAAEKNIRIITGADISRITTRDKRATVVCGGDSYDCDLLAMAAPAPAASALLREAFPEVAGKLAQLSVNKVETLGVAVEAQATPIERFASLIPVDDIFFSVVSRDVVADPKLRGFTFHFKPGVADRQAKLRRVGRLLKVEQDALTRVAVKENYVPALTVGHEVLVSEIDRLCAGTNLLLTGNYFSGMAIEDCVARSLAEFDRARF
jgi:protoporphyrinogen/coproporphyrinogen III oxidase